LNPPVGKPQRQAAVRFIFATAVLDIISLGVMIPVLPNLVRQMVGGDTAVAADYTMIFTVTWGVMQFVCSPVLGMLSDRFGRRPVLLISIFGLGLDYLLMALAPNLAWLFVGRLINGITASSFSTANAYIADVTEPEERSKAFGMMGAAFGIGFIVGPAIGGWLGGYDLRWPFYLSAVLALANWLYGWFVLPESLPVERRTKTLNWAKANPVGSLELLRAKPGLTGLASVNFLYQMAHAVFPSIFVLFVGHRYGWGPRESAVMLVATGVLSIVVQGFFVGRAVKLFGERASLLIGLCSQALAFIVYAMAPTPTVFYMGLLVGGLGGLTGPSIQGLMSRRVEPSEQGRLQGANSALMGISSIVGPALYLSLLAFAIRHEASLKLPGLPLLMAALLCLLALGAAVRFAHLKAEDPVTAA
jgi:DHA1 family tetracycline resistance protein-like MFS transporter